MVVFKESRSHEQKAFMETTIAWRSIQFQTLNLFFENSIYHSNIKPYSPNLDP
jgi:hypothetical protein